VFGLQRRQGALYQALFHSARGGGMDGLISV
jgi:hypothetical protein